MTSEHLYLTLSGMDDAEDLEEELESVLVETSWVDEVGEEVERVVGLLRKHLAVA